MRAFPNLRIPAKNQKGSPSIKIRQALTEMSTGKKGISDTLAECDGGVVTLIYKWHILLYGKKEEGK